MITSLREQGLKATKEQRLWNLYLAVHAEALAMRIDTGTLLLELRNIDLALLEEEKK